MRKFAPGVAAQIDATKYLYVRSGDVHRFIAVWVVLVDGRAIVRSWNDKPTGWYRAFRETPEGAIRLDGEVVPVTARPVRSAKLIALADKAYAAKFTTKANLQYVKGFATNQRRKHTLELIPR